MKKCIEPTEIKHPFVVLTTDEESETFSVWWKQSDGSIAFFDYIPENYPAFTVGLFKNGKEALNRLKEMTDNESWFIIGGEMYGRLKENPEYAFIPQE